MLTKEQLDRNTLEDYSDMGRTEVFVEELLRIVRAHKHEMSAGEVASLEYIERGYARMKAAKAARRLS